MGLYIIGNKKKEICKIGVSDNPDKRVKTLQTGCHFKIEILYYCDELGRDSEKEYHKRYSQYRLKGEWFKIKGEIESLINQPKRKRKDSSNNVKEIPPISFMEQQRLIKKKNRRYKKNSKHLNNVYNHK